MKDCSQLVWIQCRLFWRGLRKSLTGIDRRWGIKEWFCHRRRSPVQVWLLSELWIYFAGFLNIGRHWFHTVPHCGSWNGLKFLLVIVCVKCVLPFATRCGHLNTFLFYCAGCLDCSRWAWGHVKTLWFSKFHLSFHRVAYIHGFRTVVVLDCCTNKGQIPAEYLAGINPLEDIGKPRWQWSHGKSLVVGWNWVEINLIWKLGHSIDTQIWNVSSLWQWGGGMLKLAVDGSHSGFCPVYGITRDTRKTIKNLIISERRDRILGRE